MKSITKKQLEEQRLRWNKRADGWDNDILQLEHYANFEDGYQRFMDLLKSELRSVKKLATGLDLGCGSGITSIELGKKVKQLFILDLADDMLRIALRKVPNAVALRASATDVPLLSNSMDFVISRGVVVSHLPSEVIDDFFHELARLVRKGGKVIFDFIANIETVEYENTSPKIVFTKVQIEKKLSALGFIEIKFDGNDLNRVIRVSAIKK
ncbi:MAG: class I SAM-dependent methyltransferase [Candidatus Moraniibacteriota bacterium]